MLFSFNVLHDLSMSTLILDETETDATFFSCALFSVFCPFTLSSSILQVYVSVFHLGVFCIRELLTNLVRRIWGYMPSKKKYWTGIKIDM